MKGAYKMKKRIFLLLICLAVSVFFVSCMGLLASTTAENDQNTEEPELTVDYVIIIMSYFRVEP